MNTKQLVLYFLNALTGIIFCISAILKLISIDSFELYIYSFQFFNLNISALAARAVICGELILGTGLLVNIYPKFFRLSSLFTLIIFTLFLIYLLITQGNEGNCHCFGDLVELNPLPSVLKNLVLIVVLVFTKDIIPFRLPYKKIISICLIVISIVVIFAINPPDSWFSKNNTEYNEAAFTELIEKEQIFTNIDKETKILCFFGLGCRYCELAAKKLNLIQQNNPDVQMNFIGVFWGREEKLELFEKETELTYFDILFIDPGKFLEITNGSMPLIIIYRNGNVLSSLNYRDIQEKTLLNFLNTP